MLNKISENNEIKINVLPRFILFFPIKVLKSLCNRKMIFIQIIFSRFGKSQKISGKNEKINKVDNQFRDRFIIVVEGSKTENKLVIIFM